MKPWYCYLVQATDGSLYTGITIDLEKRVEKHNQKLGSKSLRGKLPVKLVYFEIFADELTARKREAEVKSWTREQKLQLIQNTRP